MFKFLNKTQFVKLNESEVPFYINLDLIVPMAKGYSFLLLLISQSES